MANLLNDAWPPRKITFGSTKHFAKLDQEIARLTEAIATAGN